MAKPNPFPGMDPWLEAFWGPVHHRYMETVSDQIAAQLPDGLFSEVEETVAVTHVVIRSLARHEPLVTAIELISPTNKLDVRSRRLYRRKRRAYYDAGVSVVEVDLLRAGKPLIDVPWDRVDPDLRTPYRATVRRAAVADTPEIEAEYYPIPLRDRLPVIRVPLRPTEQDIALDLQAPIDKAHEKGRYHRRIDYSKPPDPPLPADDAEWAAARIASRG